MTRYLLEGEWTGYRSSQQRIVHREIIPGHMKSRIARLGEIYNIVYSDGTSLVLSLREMKPRERVREIHGYSKLIRDAEKHGGITVHVADMAKKVAAT